jgi:hypothetical protein
VLDARGDKQDAVSDGCDEEGEVRLRTSFDNGRSYYSTFLTMAERPALSTGSVAEESAIPAAVALSGDALAETGTRAADDADARQDRLWHALNCFAESCGLSECLREAPSLPYGFMVEPPTLTSDEPALDRQAVESEVGLRRYHGWWWLVSLSLQNSPAGVAVVPEGTFAHLIETEDTWQQACDAWIGEPLLGDRFDLMFDAMLDPDHAAGGRYLDLIIAARAFRERHPERFRPQFWLAQGVDARLVQLQPGQPG